LANRWQTIGIPLHRIGMPFFMSNFALSKDDSTALFEASPRKSASPQQSLKASFHFVFGSRDL
jgi:hypothetical protein